MDDPDYFMSVDRPKEFRKQILEASKDIILTLKDYHKLQSIRKNKLDLISVLRDQIKEMTFLMNKLDERLPDKKIEYEHDIYEAKHKPQVEKKDEAPEKTVEQPVQESSDEVDHLENALKSIEEKLNKL